MTEAPTPDELRELASASLERVTPWEVAFHEAGHVVAEWAVAGSGPDGLVEEMALEVASDQVG